MLRFLTVIFDQINIAAPLLLKSVSQQAISFLKSILDLNFVPPDGFLTPGEGKLLSPTLSVSVKKLYLLNFIFHKTLMRRVFFSAKYFDRIQKDFR
jgi:hypothetical protein